VWAAAKGWKTSLTGINAPSPPLKSEPKANKIDDWLPTSALAEGSGLDTLRQ